MKKLIFIFLFTTTSSYSQIHFLTHKTEKITYSEYDNLKYINSLDEDFSFDQNIVRYYDNAETLLYSISSKTAGNKTVTILIYPTSTIEYIINDNIANISVTMTGILKINGSNKFLTITSCNPETCTYWFYVNQKQTYTETVKTIK